MSIWRGFRATNEPRSAEPAPYGKSGGVSNAVSDLDLAEWVGEYVILRKLGEGGFGAVYEALHPVIGKRAAVKVLHAQYSADEAVTSRFAAEARAVNQIRHKNIVDIFSFGELPDGRQYYVMELLEGVPLDLYLERAGQLALGECLAILAEIAKALKAAHDAGIAHRDLKPENVFLRLDDEQLVHPKILDFGMAKLLAPGTLPVHKTRSGAPIGSPRYMSPEQCRGVEVDHRTDVYAFGCMAYRMLAGVPPFDGGTALELMMAHVSATPSPLSNIGPDLGPKLDEALLKMMEKLPENRPQGILEAFESLRLAAPATDLEVTPGASLIASSLLLEMAQERSEVKAPALDVSRLRRTPGGSQLVPPRARHFWPWVLTPLLLGAIAFAWLQEQGRMHQHNAATSATVSIRTVAPAATAVVPAKPAATEVPKVAITINTYPSHAELYLGKEKVGVAPGPLSLPQGEAPLTLMVKSLGHHPQTVQFVPSGDKTLRVALQPLKPRSGGVPHDLEDPY